MDTSLIIDELFIEWKNIMLLYNSALKEVTTKIEILNSEFQTLHQHNPIEHIKTRIKSPESTIKKLKRKGHEVTMQNASNYIDDIAGIRIICSFISDIYSIADFLANQNDIRVLKVKDYIKSPKPNGYRSYHMLIEIPIFLTDRVENVKVEVQIRTIAMDFWASLDHKIHYKFEGNAPLTITDELKECADVITYLDEKMMNINKQIKQCD